MTTPPDQTRAAEIAGRLPRVKPLFQMRRIEGDEHY